MVVSLSTEQYAALTLAPERAGAEHLPFIDDIILRYPYFCSARMLRLYILCHLDDVRSAQEIERTAVYAPSPATLYNYVHRQSKTANDDEQIPAGSYFDTLRRMEQQAKTTHKSLAELAREMSRAQHKSIEQQDGQPKETYNTENQPNVDELIEYRESIKKGDFELAIEILSQINLHNPKKITYFAERKRYLELVSGIAAQKRNG